MSVPVPQRNESRLEVQVRIEDLIIHTLAITANEKIFDPKYKTLTDRVIDCAVGIGQDAWEANGIRVRNDDKSWPVRYGLQNRAIRQLDVLLYLMTLCRRAFHLRTKKYEHWVALARDARAMARKWRDSDVRRYGRPKSGIPGC